MEQKYLPIGSVCTLKGKNKKVMITGYYSVEYNGNLKIQDYCGCAYPEGMLLPEQYCTFNHTDIENIDFLGFKNDEYQTFKRLFDRLTGTNQSVEEANLFHENNDMFLTSNSTYSKLLFDENGVVMIAEPVIKDDDKKNSSTDYEFNESGTVISAKSYSNTENPFYKKIEIPEITQEKNLGLNIFNKIEFDENGTVISTEFEEKKQTMLNKIEFDENGTVISVNGDALKEEYEFDENGTLIAVGSDRLEEDIPLVGPGLPGYEKPSNKKVSNYKFDSEGKVVVEEKYEFDENGTLVAVDVEEDIPPVGPGLPGYVDPKKETKYEFDENGTVVEAN